MEKEKWFFVVVLVVVLVIIVPLLQGSFEVYREVRRLKKNKKELIQSTDNQ